MKILVRGRDAQIEEFQLKFGERPNIEFDNENRSNISFGQYDVVFDFFLDEFPENLDHYFEEKNLIVFCNSVKSTLTEFSYYLDHDFKFTILGFNGLKSFFNRDVLEISLLASENIGIAEKVCTELETEFEIVADRVGMVSPRVICMIINEAYYTMQEGTADKKAIDMAMKLGTSYPYGPFEWADRIGLDNVYELLEAVYEDTKDERYKICPALKKEYLLN